MVIAQLNDGLRYTDWGYETSSRKWNRGRNGLHQLEQPVEPSILFPGRRFISPVCISLDLSASLGALFKGYLSLLQQHGLIVRKLLFLVLILFPVHCVASGQS